MEDLKGMSDEDLTNLLDDTSDEGAEDTSTEQTDRVGEVSETPDVQDSNAETVAQDNTRTEDKTPRMVPLAEVQRERQRRQQAEAYLNDPEVLSRQLQQLGYQVQQQQAQQQPEFLDDTLAQFTQDQLQTLRSDFTQTTQSMRVEMSEMMARQAYSDYDDTLQSLTDLKDDPVLGPIITASLPSLSQSSNPALAAYQLAKRLTTQQSSQVDVKAEIAKGIAEALAKQKGAIQSPKGVARAGSVSSGAEGPKGLRQMTAEDLLKAQYDED